MYRLNKNSVLFIGNLVANASVSIPWNIPKNAKILDIITVGAGGAGASGQIHTLLSETYTYGGGGGASGNRAELIIDRECLPDVLHIIVSAGGRVNVSSGAGMVSTVSVAPGVVTGVDALLGSSFSGNAGGGSGATGGAPGAIFSAASTKYAGAGVLTSQIGQAGGNAGTSVTWSIGVFGSGGAGGGNYDDVDVAYAGDDVTGAGSIVKTISGGATGNNGNVGRQYKYSWFTGGSGGGAGAEPGGKGGSGTWGCGGGGGGSTTDGFGTGGDGGPGFVMIRWW